MAHYPEIAPPISIRGLVRGTGLALTVVLLANAVFAAVLMVRPMNKGNQIIQAKFALAEKPSREAVDWVFVGDSSCNQGVRPDVFEEITGESAVNLCTIGNLLVAGDAWALERWLEHHPPPRKGIAMIHVYDVWPRTEEALDGNAWVVPGGPTWRMTRTPASGDWREVLEAAAGSWVPLYTQSTTVSSVLVRPWTLSKSFVPSFDDSGFMLGATADPKSVVRDVKTHAKRLLAAKEEEPVVSEVNRQALAIVEAKAIALGVDFALFLAPTAASLAEEPLFQTRLATLETELGAVMQGSSLHLDPKVFPDAVMENADHLSEDAAADFTAHVAKTLR